MSSSKLNHFVDFGQVKIDPTCSFGLTLAGHSYTAFWQGIRP